MASGKSRVMVVSAVPMTLGVFMRPHLEAMLDWLDVTAVCDANPQQMVKVLPEGVTYCPVRIMRQISLLRDIAALLKLARLFVRARPTLVHSITPKAGLLAMLAAFISRVPVRVHVFTGQVWATRRGVSRLIFRLADRLTASLATHVLTDSESQRGFLIQEGVCSKERIRVLASGSICGVDLQRFRPSAETRGAIREQLAIPASAVVVLFVGRLTHDKGVLDLASAFATLAGELSAVHLLLVGPDEDGLGREIKKRTATCAERVHLLGMSDRPEDFMAAADIFALPSYREGFGSVVIEAAACGIPAVASRIYGVTDAVEEGRTGLLHTPGYVEDLERVLREMVVDGERRSIMGMNARARVENSFSVGQVVSAQMAFYREILGAAGGHDSPTFIEGQK